MPWFTHKGGSLTVGAETIYYGPGLHKSCPTCKVSKNVRCITSKGALLKKCHQARL